MRRPLAVTFVSQCAGLASLLIVLPFAHGTGFDGADVAWGAAGGMGGAVALVCFYWALAAGTMSVVAPLTAVVSAIVPVATGLALGERPSVWSLVGVALALPAIALIARETARARRGPRAWCWRRPWWPASASASSSWPWRAPPATAGCGPWSAPA